MSWDSGTTPGAQTAGELTSRECKAGCGNGRFARQIFSNSRDWHVFVLDALGSPGGSSPIFRAYRISPKDGKRLWEFEQQNAPDQIDFSDNRVLMLNGNAITVLKYLTF